MYVSEREKERKRERERERERERVRTMRVKLSNLTLFKVKKKGEITKEIKTSLKGLKFSLFCQFSNETSIKVQR